MSSLSDEADSLLGTVLAERYRLEEKVGEGGIGSVYRARHLTLGNYVAVKVLLAEYQDRPMLRKRFEREATALAELNHPNIVRVTDFGARDQLLFIAMELLEGQDLAALVGDEALTPRRAVEIIRQVLRALDYAHRRHVVHRDVKPHNVFVRALDGQTDHVQVLDFGLARFVREASQAGQPLTKVGTVLGTPAYMAPEQATGGEAGAPADVYSVGVMFFELLAGRRPFDDKDPAELLRAHILTDPPLLRQVTPQLEVSRELEAVIRRAMEKTPADRYPDAGAMLGAIDGLAPDALKPRWRSEPPPRSEKHDPATAHTAIARSKPKALGSAPVEQQPASTGSDRPTTARRGPLPWIAGIVVLTGIVGGIGAVIAWSDPDPTATDGAPPDDDVEVAPSPPPDEPVEGVEPPALASRDPFAAPLPDELAPLHQKLESGRSLSDSELGRLRSFARAHPEDPRPLLLQAHHHVDVRSLSWAYPLYVDAINLDPSVSGDPAMLPDMLEMVRSESLHRAAVDFIVEVYGARALPAVDAQLTERMRRAEEQRLEALRARLLVSNR